MELENMLDKVEPEKDEHPEKEAPEKEERKDYVPLATHLEERNQLRAKIQELEARQARFGNLESELREMREQLKAAEKEPEKAPDYLEDPKGYIDENVKSLASKVKELESRGQATAEQITQRQQLEDAQAKIKAHVDAFADKTGDFDDALEFARQQRLEDLKLVYPDATNAQLQAALAVEEFRTGVTLVNQGRNPGEFIYEYAKRRGYKPQSSEDKEEMAAKRDRAEGLGAGAGSASELENLLDKDDDEFDQAMREVFGA